MPFFSVFASCRNEIESDDYAVAKCLGRFPLKSGNNRRVFPYVFPRKCWNRDTLPFRPIKAPEQSLLYVGAALLAQPHRQEHFSSHSPFLSLPGYFIDFPHVPASMWNFSVRSLFHVDFSMYSVFVHFYIIERATLSRAFSFSASTTEKKK